MIKYLDITNFQSHEESRLEFSPGVNVIIGQSDSGKTAIFRALDWVVNNQPQGSNFRSHWGGDTLVRLTLTDGTQVWRKKHGAAGNLYRLCRPKEKELNFLAFGSNVPEEIVKTLNMTPLNWSRQLDPPFLLSCSSGEVARTLNEIVNLEVIDQALSNINVESRTASGDLRSQEAQQVLNLEALKKFDYLDAIEAKVEAMEKLQDELNALQVKAPRLEFLLERGREKFKTVKRMEELLLKGQPLEKVLDLNKSLDELVEKEARLVRLGKSIREKEDVHAKAQRITGQAKAIEGLYQLSEKLRKLEDRDSQLSRMVDRLARNETLLTSATNTLKSLEKQWHEMKPDICPLCGQKWPGEEA